MRDFRDALITFIRRGSVPRVSIYVWSRVLFVLQTRHRRTVDPGIFFFLSLSLSLEHYDLCLRAYLHPCAQWYSSLLSAKFFITELGYSCKILFPTRMRLIMYLQIKSNLVVSISVSGLSRATPGEEEKKKKVNKKGTHARKEQQQQQQGWRENREEKWRWVGVMPESWLPSMCA